MRLGEATVAFVFLTRAGRCHAGEEKERGKSGQNSNHQSLKKKKRTVRWRSLEAASFLPSGHATHWRDSIVVFLPRTLYKTSVLIRPFLQTRSPAFFDHTTFPKIHIYNHAHTFLHFQFGTGSRAVNFSSSKSLYCGDWCSTTSLPQFF